MAQEYWEEYVWVVAVGGLMAFFMAFGIGANDVANAFATSVGSKTLTLFQATILAAIFEFSGALLLGRGVTDTVKSGIIDQDQFEDIPEVFMYAMLCALIAAGCWLILATYLELPVSTTHAIIGGLVGAGMTAKGGGCVIWHKLSDDPADKFPVKGISAVVISWFFSPVASGIVAGGFFLLTRNYILRKEDSFNRTFLFLPLLVVICVFINAFYVLDKGISKQAAIDTAQSAWIAAIISVISFFLTFAIASALKKRVLSQEKAAEAAEGTVEGGVASSEKEESSSTSFFAKLSAAINSNDPHVAVDEEANVRDIHDNAEVFDERTENIFRYLQVLTSCCDSFAHGANDVANSIGPFSAIWAIYKEGTAGSKSEVPVWILIIGGTGITIGLGTYGYSIIKAIGVKLTKITPSRGYCIELGSALVVVTGSYIGLPLSTTHCQVGATIFVGLVEGAKGVSWIIVAKSVAGWIFTLIIVGFAASILMALAIYSPNLRSLEAINNLKVSVEERNIASIRRFEAECPDSGTFLNNLEATEVVSNGTTTDNYRFPLRIPAMLDYLSGLEQDLMTVASCPVGANFEAIDPKYTALYPVEEEVEGEEEEE